MASHGQDVHAAPSNGIAAAGFFLVTAAGIRELAADRGEDDPDFISKPDQNRDGDDGNKGQDQGVLDEGLAFSGSLLAAGLFFRIHTIAQLLI